MCDVKAQEDEGPEEGEIQDDDEEEEPFLYLSSSSSSYERDIRNHERHRAARKYMPRDSSTSLSMSIINDRMLSRTNHERRDKSRIRPKYSESSHHKTSVQPRSGLTHGKENRHVHQSRDRRSPVVHHTERPKSKSPNRSPASRDHSKFTSKSQKSASDNASTQNTEVVPEVVTKVVTKEVVVARKSTRRRRRGGKRKRQAIAELAAKNVVKLSHSAGEIHDDAINNTLCAVEGSEANCLKRKLLTMGALGNQSESVVTVPEEPVVEAFSEELPSNITETAIAHLQLEVQNPSEKSCEPLSKEGKDAEDVDGGVIFIAAVPKPVPELVTLSDSDAEQDTTIEAENVDIIKGTTDMEMSRSSASSNIDMDLDTTLVESSTKNPPASTVSQSDHDDDDIVSLRQAALMSKTKTTKNSTTNAEPDEDDLQLRVAALRSAVLRKAEVRKKRRLQAVGGPFLGDETTPVDMDLADTDEEEDSMQPQPQASPEHPPLPMPPMPSESLLKTVNVTSASRSYFCDPDPPAPCHYIQTSFVEPGLPTQLQDEIPGVQIGCACAGANNAPTFQMGGPGSVAASAPFHFPDCPSALRQPDEIVAQINLPKTVPLPVNFLESGFPGHPNEYSAQVQTIDFPPHPASMEFPVPLEYAGVPLEYSTVPPVPADYPANIVEYHLREGNTVDYDPSIPTPYLESMTFDSIEELVPLPNFIPEEWNPEENQAGSPPELLSSILTKAMKRKMHNIRPNLREIEVNQPPEKVQRVADKPYNETADLELSSMVILDEVPESPVPSPGSVTTDADTTGALHSQVQRQANVDDDEMLLREKLLKALSSKRDTAKLQDKITNKPTDKSCKHINKSTNNADISTSIPAADTTAKKPADKTTSNAADKTTSSSVDKTTNNSVDKTTSKTTNKPSGETISEPSGKTINKPPGKTSNKPSDKIISKPRDQCTKKPSEKAVEAQSKDKVLPSASKLRDKEVLAPQAAKPNTSALAMSKDRRVYSKADSLKVQVQSRNAFPMRKPEGAKPKPKTVSPAFQFIIQLGEDSDSSDGLEGAEEPDDLNLPRREHLRQTNMYHMKDYCPRTVAVDSEKDVRKVEDEVLLQPPLRSESDLSKEVDKFLKDVRSSHEASVHAVADIPQVSSTVSSTMSPTVSQVAVLKPVHVTPLAVRHLPASKQEEYRKLKQMIAERELQKKALKKQPNNVQSQPRHQPIVADDLLKLPTKVKTVPMPKTSPKTSATLPVTSATLPVPSVTLPVPSFTLPVPSVTLPVPPVTLPVPSVTLPVPPVTLPVPPVALPVPPVALPVPPVALPVPPVALPVPPVALPVPAVTLPVPPVTLPVSSVTLPVPSATLPVTSTKSLVTCAAQPKNATLSPKTPTPLKTPPTSPETFTLTPPKTCLGSEATAPTSNSTATLISRLDVPMTRFVTAKTLVKTPSSGPVPARTSNSNFFRGAPIKYAQGLGPAMVSISAPKVSPATVGHRGKQTHRIRAQAIAVQSVAVPSESQRKKGTVASVSVSQQASEKQLEQAEMNLLKERSAVVGQIMGLTRLQNETETAMVAQEICESKLLRIMEEFDMACKDWRERSNEVKEMMQNVKAKREELRGSYVRTEVLARSCKFLGAKFKGACYTLPVGNMMQTKQKVANQQYGRMIQWKKAEQSRMRTIIEKTDSVSAFLKSRCQEALSIRVNPTTATAPAPAQPSLMIPVTLLPPPPELVPQKESLTAPLPALPETPKAAVAQTEEKSEKAENRNSPSMSCARRLVRVAKRRLREVEGCKPREVGKRPIKMILGMEDDNDKPAQKQLQYLTRYKSPLDHLGNTAALDEFFDPEAILCPYELNGKCEDDECIYQHQQVKGVNRDS